MVVIKFNNNTYSVVFIPHRMDVHVVVVVVDDDDDDDDDGSCLEK